MLSAAFVVDFFSTFFDDFEVLDFYEKSYWAICFGKPFRVVRKGPGVHLGASGGVRELSWGDLGVSEGVREASWEGLASGDPSGGRLGAPGASLEPLEPKECVRGAKDRQGGRPGGPKGNSQSINSPPQTTKLV